MSGADVTMSRLTVSAYASRCNTQSGSVPELTRFSALPFSSAIGPTRSVALRFRRRVCQAHSNARVLKYHFFRRKCKACNCNS